MLGYKCQWENVKRVFPFCMYNDNFWRGLWLQFIWYGFIWARTKTYCVLLKSEENKKNENYDSIHWKKKKFELCKKRSTQILPTKMKVKPLHGWHFPNPSISTTFNELYTSLKFCTSFSNTFNTRTFQRLNTWLCWGVLSQWMACTMIMLMIQTEWLVQWSGWWFKQRQNFPP